MGGIKREQNRYRRPRKIYDKKRIEEEKKLREKYGLKNNKEIWKAEYQIRKIRRLAKKMITQPIEKQKEFIESIRKKGFDVKSIGDILGLNKEEYLKRRLQTFVYKRGLAKTIKEARQLVTHKKIKVGDRIVNVPSYFINKDEENKIERVA
ncbi:MAG: 30S ribosomal protein S4 [Candidatus Pacearchaeota archaeon]